MGKIRCKDTKPELAVRRIVFGLGYRYRLHVTTLPGNPDIVLPRHRKVIFVHGCFWHQHSCSRGTFPSTRPDFWAKKFSGNKQRDQNAQKELRRLGWKVLTLWECEVQNKERVTKRLLNFLKPLNRL